MPDSPVLPTELRAWMNLLAAAGAVEQQLRAQVKETLGVSHDEFLVLCLLADHPAGLHMTQVAKLLGRPKTRLTYQIAMLHGAGLVTRGGTDGDKRCIRVALTDKARHLLAEAAAPLACTITKAVAHALGPGQHEVLRGLLAAADGTEDVDR
jgi:DNA-binding MarR family transcriptional regulator